jgi:hypothetical protein
VGASHEGLIWGLDDVNLAHGIAVDLGLPADDFDKNDRLIIPGFDYPRFLLRGYPVRKSDGEALSVR